MSHAPRTTPAATAGWEKVRKLRDVISFINSTQRAADFLTEIAKTTPTELKANLVELHRDGTFSRKELIEILQADLPERSDFAELGLTNDQFKILATKIVNEALPADAADAADAAVTSVVPVTPAELVGPDTVRPASPIVFGPGRLIRTDTTTLTGDSRLDAPAHLDRE